MADRPIIFSAPMVRALLSGRKTQTRRLSKPEPASSKPRTGSTLVHEGVDGSDFYRRVVGHFRPRFAVGDRLWVKENHRLPLSAEGPRGITKYGPVFYAADQHWYLGQDAVPGKLRPSIHMPRWASRMTLVVTDVQVERLNDISEADAIAEGLFPTTCGGQRMWDPGPPHGHFGDPRVAYRMIWEDINGPGSWDANPWVVAVTFEKHGAIDSMPRGEAVK